MTTDRTPAGFLPEDFQSDDTSFRFSHTDNVPRALEQLGVTLCVSTYQAGKLAVFYANDGRLTMLPRTFDKAMGFAINHDQLALGTRFQVWTLKNEPILVPKLGPHGEYDACYVPRTSHVTGYIDIHEMAFGSGELWVVNTAFSCLCTLDSRYSFVPRWRPPFVSEIQRGDRCHLNGVAMQDGSPRYVTAFAETDTAEAWREHKRDGGCVIDVQTNKIVARGFSMPHSPRVDAAGKLWLLDSGNGRLVTVDPASGESTIVCALPGFTRGLAFCGPYAFVGLSKVREKAVFGGIKIEETISDPKSGVWIVDTRTGETVGFIEFEKTIEEVFDVQVLTGIRRPAVVGLQKPTIQKACVVGPELGIHFRPT
ncbi:MAG: TIGR03032 family protein [Planctomycetales bacterium]|nr:TIGR03032 family protein [Planctomycetales bacterium]MCA9168048.1 TIGR03032 family protein [Planctomycetales bacterium]